MSSVEGVETGEEVEKLLWVLKSLRAPVTDIEIRRDPHLGEYIVLKIDVDASQALELWLRLLDALQSVKTPIFVE